MKRFPEFLELRHFIFERVALTIATQRLTFLKKQNTFIKVRSLIYKALVKCSQWTWLPKSTRGCVRAPDGYKYHNCSFMSPFEQYLTVSCCKMIELCLVTIPEWSGLVGAWRLHSLNTRTWWKIGGGVWAWVHGSLQHRLRILDIGVSRSVVEALLRELDPDGTAKKLKPFGVDLRESCTSRLTFHFRRDGVRNRATKVLWCALNFTTDLKRMLIT